jgi:hypothetical protein
VCSDATVQKLPFTNFEKLDEYAKEHP